MRTGDKTDTINVIAYARVSTPKQAIEGNGLDIQVDRLEAGCTRQDWRIVPAGKVLQEPFTGGTDQRPVYELALKFMKDNPGLVRYFVVANIDRFSREGSMRYQQMKAELAMLRVELRDLTGIIQPQSNSLEHFGFSYEWSTNSPSQISEIVIAETARFEKSQILTRMVGAQIKLTQDGYHIGRPDDGYISKRIFVDNKRKYALFPDPDRVHLFREIFRLRAEGAYSDEDIVRRVNAQGFRTKAWKKWNADHTEVIGLRQGVPLSVKQLQRIVQRPIYCGIVCEKWTHGQPVRARGGESVVSIEQFNAANYGKIYVEEGRDGSITIVHQKTGAPVVPRRRTYNDAFPFKNVVLCPRCMKPLTASFSRGKSGKRFGAYHCARKHRRYAVPKRILEPVFRTYIDGLGMAPNFAPVFEEEVVAVFRREERNAESARGHAKHLVAELEEQSARLATAFELATAPAMRRELERKLVAVEERLEVARGEGCDLELTEADIRDFVAHAQLLVEHPAEILTGLRDRHEQIAIFRLFFTELPTYDKLVNGTPSLSLTLRVSEAFKNDEYQLMNVPGRSWNTWVEEIKHWKNCYRTLDILAQRAKSRHTTPRAA